jgi:hypothetical protein
VKPSRLRPKYRNMTSLYTFHRRDFSPAQAKEIEKERDQFFERMTQKFHYRFGFYNGFESPITPNEELVGACGVTFQGKNLLFSFLDLKMVEPLIFQKKDLTDCEGMGNQWFIALTLVHEIMVRVP